MSQVRRLGPPVSGASRVPPHNLEAEESVLGACLLARTALGTALEIVGPEDFYKPAHGEMFRLMLGLLARGEPVDAVTVGEELRRVGTLDEFGGKPYLFTLVNSVPTPGSVGYYAKIVAENAALRRLIDASQQISDLAFALPDDVEEAQAQAQGVIYAATQARDTGGLAGIEEVIEEAHAGLDASASAEVTGVPSGLRALDGVTTGLQPENLVVLAARTSDGKSALGACAWVIEAARAGYPVLLFSLEMSKAEIGQRMIGYVGDIELERLKRGQLTLAESNRYSTALGELVALPITVDDSISPTVLEMGAKSRRLKSSPGGLGLVVVDYLQIVPPLAHRSNREQDVSEVSRALKVLARQLKIPVLALAQLKDSRRANAGPDRRPQVYDLRESGSIENDADAVILIWHPKGAGLPPGAATLIVGKNRNGPKRDVRVRWNEDYVRFESGAW